MSISSSLKRVINNPLIIYAHLLQKWPFTRVSDEYFVKAYYYCYHHERLNLENPRKFNEKLQWLKLYDRNPLYSQLTDKFLVKEYISKKIGPEYVAKLLGVWENPEEIDFDNLPKQFVLKCNHDSGSIIICRDKSSFNKDDAISKLNKALNTEQFFKAREFAYKNIEKRIIAEEYLSEIDKDELMDYKFLCFNGEPMFVSTDKGRFSGTHIRNYYTADWKFVDVRFGELNDPNNLDPRPKNLDKMLEICRTLAKGIPHVRVDMYNIDGKILFGELTFYHGGGTEIITPVEYEYIWGDLINLPLKEKGFLKNN